MSIAVFVPVIAAVVVVILLLRQSPRSCPECGEAFPAFRKPANRRQALWGGWTCPKCGGKVDRNGRRVVAN